MCVCGEGGYKLCAALYLYVSIETQAERREMAIGVMTRIEDFTSRKLYITVSVQEDPMCICTNFTGESFFFFFLYC